MDKQENVNNSSGGSGSGVPGGSGQVDAGPGLSPRKLSRQVLVWTGVIVASVIVGSVLGFISLNAKRPDNPGGFNVTSVENAKPHETNKPGGFTPNNDSAVPSVSPTPGPGGGNATENTAENTAGNGGGNGDVRDVDWHKQYSQDELKAMATDDNLSFEDQMMAARQVNTYDYTIDNQQFTDRMNSCFADFKANGDGWLNSDEAASGAVEAAIGRCFRWDYSQSGKVVTAAMSVPMQVASVTPLDMSTGLYKIVTRNGEGETLLGFSCFYNPDSGGCGIDKVELTPRVMAGVNSGFTDKFRMVYLSDGN